MTHLTEALKAVAGILANQTINDRIKEDAEKTARLLLSTLEKNCELEQIQLDEIRLSKSKIAI